MRLLAAVFLLLSWPVHGVAQSTAAPATEPLILQPGDVVRIEVWRENDLGGEFLVERSGAIVLPLLGERVVTGVPFQQVRDSLMAEYRLQLRNPSITIVPLRRVYVLGEVNQPGLLTVDPTITLAGAVALAGGATAAGDLRRIRVVREGRVVLADAPADHALSSADVQSGDQIFVERRSWFERNSTFVVSALLSVTSVLITLLR